MRRVETALFTAPHQTFITSTNKIEWNNQSVNTKVTGRDKTEMLKERLKR